MRILIFTMERTDDELITLHRSGDPEAFRTLVERYLDAIYAFARRMTGSPNEADDIAQETFVKIWKTLDRYRLTGTFRAWVFAVARNTAIDHLRKKKSAVFSDFENAEGKNTLTETLADPETLPETLLDRAEDKKLLDGALGELPEIDRQIMTLHYSEDMTFEAIGRALKKPLNTVKSRHRRALEKLREYFEKSP